MYLILTGNWDSYAQFIAVLVIFVLVLGVTAAVTKWIAKYQKQQNVNCNIEVIETTRIAANKYIQIVRVGELYVALALCKDTVTTLCEIPAQQLKEKPETKTLRFEELLCKALKKDSGKSDEPKGL